MQAEQAVKEILVKHFMETKSRNARFSMRAYAKKVGVTQSALSEIFSGQRSITAKMALKIMNGVCLEPYKIEEIMQSFSKRREKQLQQLTYQSLTMDTYHLISEWYYFALLSLAETQDFQCDPKWISQRLGITVAQINQAVDRLEKLALIEVDPETKKWKATGVRLRIDPGIATAALKYANRENLELAAVALESTQFEERDFTAMTLCFDQSRMEEAKRRIKEFRESFAADMESKNKNEVYKICIQLFPLTKQRKIK